MALQSQGLRILHGASTYTSTQYSANGIDGIKFVAASSSINNTNGDFTADFTTTMEIWSNSTANPGPWHAKSVAATIITVQGAVTHTTNGTAFILYGKEMGEIGQVKDINVVTGSAPVIDVTHLGSTAKEKLVGVPDFGQLTFSVFQDFGATCNANMLDEMKVRGLNRYEVKFTDNATHPTRLFFEGYVVSQPITGGLDNPLTQQFTVEITGPVKETTAE